MLPIINKQHRKDEQKRYLGPGTIKNSPCLGLLKVDPIDSMLKRNRFGIYEIV